MKIQELLSEQTIGTVGSGTGGTVPPVQPTMGANTVPGQPSSTDPSKQTSSQSNSDLVAQIRSRLNDLKPAIKTASGQDFDSNILAQTLAGQATGGASGMPSNSAKALKASVIPSIANALQNTQTTNSLKTALNTANQAKLKQQQGQQQQQQGQLQAQQSAQAQSQPAQTPVKI